MEVFVAIIKDETGCDSTAFDSYEKAKKYIKDKEKNSWFVDHLDYRTHFIESEETVGEHYSSCYENYMDFYRFYIDKVNLL